MLIDLDNILTMQKNAGNANINDKIHTTNMRRLQLRSVQIDRD